MCEIVGASAAGAGGAGADLAQLRHPRRVPHLWIADSGARAVEVYRLTASGYEPVTRAEVGTTVRAAPFDGIAIFVDELFAGVS